MNNHPKFPPEGCKVADRDRVSSDLYKSFQKVFNHSNKIDKEGEMRNLIHRDLRISSSEAAQHWKKVVGEKRDTEEKSPVLSSQLLNRKEKAKRKAEKRKRDLANKRRKLLEKLKK